MKPFTVDHANRTLPLVRRIVEDVVASQRRWQETIAELDVLAADARTDLPDPRIVALEKQAQRIADRRIGLIDFPSELDGRRVLLCWRLGEPSVQFWHDEDAGFAGRQPLSPTLVG
jgi:hypothetical protein